MALREVKLCLLGSYQWNHQGDWSTWPAFLAWLFLERAQDSLRVVVVVVVDSGVGKSSIVLRFVRDQYKDNMESTIGASFMTKRMTLGDRSFVFQIWDTAGQEKYRALAPMYYRGAAAAIIVYDVTREASYIAVKDWIQELRKNATMNLVIAIAGNKCDLNDLREVNTDEARSYAEEIDAFFTETSALTAINIQELFESIAKRLPAEEVYRPLGSSVNVRSNASAQQEKKGCCGRSKT